MEIGRVDGAVLRTICLKVKWVRRIDLAVAAAVANTKRRTEISLIGCVVMGGNGILHFNLLVVCTGFVVRAWVTCQITEEQCKCEREQPHTTKVCRIFWIRSRIRWIDRISRILGQDFLDLCRIHGLERFGLSPSKSFQSY
jgi:hypothetical protein